MCIFYPGGKKSGSVLFAPKQTGVNVIFSQGVKTWACIQQAMFFDTRSLKVEIMMP